MIWLQGGLCFLLWMSYGVIQMRRSVTIRQWARAIPRARRALLAGGLMLGGIAPVFVVLSLGLQYNGFGSSGMNPVLWLGVAAFGLLFVHGQTLATALLVTAAQESVTDGPPQASSIQRPSISDEHEASPP